MTLENQNYFSYRLFFLKTTNLNEFHEFDELFLISHTIRRKQRLPVRSQFEQFVKHYVSFV